MDIDDWPISPWILWYYPYYTNYIRLSIFLITGVCVGFPALIWAFGVLYSQHKSRGGISTIAIFLLLSDLLELILNPLLVSYTFSVPGMFKMLFGVRLCGHQLHQLMVLESIITLKYPSLAHIFSPTCSMTLCSIVSIVGIGSQFLPTPLIQLINILSCVLPILLCAVTCLMTCKASPDTNQATDRKPGVLVLCVAMFTLFILYAPFFLTIYVGLPFMLDSLTSMRLFSEPLLCVLICREIHIVKPHTHN